MNPSSAQDLILAALRQVLPEGETHPLHAPSFQGNEWTYVKECLDTGWVSSAGAFVDRFELHLQETTGVPHAVAVVNGTAALHVALHVAGVRPGDEVIVPALTFVATANAVTYCGATPHFADSERATLGIDPQRLDRHLDEILVVRSGTPTNRTTGRPLRAVIAMHVFGHPVDLDPLARVCDRHGLVLIEDAAEALGTCYRGTHVGRWGLVSTLSFNGNKTLTTGGGGALLTRDAELARRARHLTTTAKQSHAWEYHHDEVGFNYRLPNINAALGCAQIEQLPDLLHRKRTLAHRYRAVFDDVDGAAFVEEPEFATSNYWLNAILLDASLAPVRDSILEGTHAAGILTRPVWQLMPDLPMYNGCPRMSLPVAGDLQRRLVNLPSSPSLIPASIPASP
jgi:perosamine synthetase